MAEFTNQVTEEALIGKSYIFLLNEKFEKYSSEKQFEVYAAIKTAQSFQFALEQMKAKEDMAFNSYDGNNSIASEILNSLSTELGGTGSQQIAIELQKALTSSLSTQNIILEAKNNIQSMTIKNLGNKKGFNEAIQRLTSSPDDVVDFINNWDEMMKRVSEYCKNNGQAELWTQVINAFKTEKHGYLPVGTIVSRSKSGTFAEQVLKKAKINKKGNGVITPGLVKGLMVQDMLHSYQKLLSKSGGVLTQKQVINLQAIIKSCVKAWEGKSKNAFEFGAANALSSFAYDALGDELNTAIINNGVVSMGQFHTKFDQGYTDFVIQKLKSAGLDKIAKKNYTHATSKPDAALNFTANSMTYSIPISVKSYDYNPTDPSLVRVYRIQYESPIRRIVGLSHVSLNKSDMYYLSNHLALYKYNMNRYIYAKRWIESIAILTALSGTGQMVGNVVDNALLFVTENAVYRMSTIIEKLLQNDWKTGIGSGVKLQSSFSPEFVSNDRIGLNYNNLSDAYERSARVLADIWETKVTMHISFG